MTSKRKAMDEAIRRGKAKAARQAKPPGPPPPPDPEAADPPTTSPATGTSASSTAPSRLPGPKGFDAASRDARVRAFGRVPHGTAVVKVWDGVRGVWVCTFTAPSGDEDAPAFKVVHAADGAFKAEEQAFEKYRRHLEQKGGGQ